MYSLFLDESMMYSSGVHHDGESLYQAQMNKLDAVIEQVGGGGREAGGRGGSRKPLGGGVGSKQIGDSHGGRSTPINSQQLFPPQRSYQGLQAHMAAIPYLSPLLSRSQADIRASDHVLEIGCGWGGFAIRAAQVCVCVWGGGSSMVKGEGG